MELADDCCSNECPLGNKLIPSHNLKTNFLRPTPLMNLDAKRLLRGCVSLGHQGDGTSWQEKQEMRLKSDSDWTPPCWRAVR